MHTDSQGMSAAIAEVADIENANLVIVTTQHQKQLLQG